jgi:uncharacterized protein YlaI
MCVLCHHDETIKHLLLECKHLLCHPDRLYLIPNMQRCEYIQQLAKWCGS